MMKLKSGDLAFVPSEAYLYRFDNLKQQQAATAAEYVKLDRPINILVIDADASEEYYRVFYENKKDWYVKKRDVYEVKDGKY